MQTIVMRFFYEQGRGTMTTYWLLGYVKNPSDSTTVNPVYREGVNIHVPELPTPAFVAND